MWRTSGNRPEPHNLDQTERYSLLILQEKLAKCEGI